MAPNTQLSLELQPTDVDSVFDSNPKLTKYLLKHPSKWDQESPNMRCKMSQMQFKHHSSYQEPRRTPIREDN